MRKTGLILLASTLLFLGSCDSGDIECVRASDEVITEIRDFNSFDGVVTNIVGDVSVSQGAGYAVKITGPDNVVAQTSTSIDGHLLVVGSDACFNGAYDLKVEVTAPDFSLINLSGVGDISTVGIISAGRLEMEMMGAGKITAQVDADTLLTLISGTGEIAYNGTAARHDLICAGKYTLNAYDLMTEDTYIQLTGTGDSYISASNRLDVRITGNGNVFYKGNPVVTREIIGTGDVLDKN